MLVVVAVSWVKVGMSAGDQQQQQQQQQQTAQSGPSPSPENPFSLQGGTDDDVSGRGTIAFAGQDDPNKVGFVLLYSD